LKKKKINSNNKIMKKTILILIGGLLISITGFGQTSQKCDTVTLNTAENVTKAEPCVLIAADYVLSKPLHGNVQLYSDYRKFVLSWMDKSPDYTFTLNEKMMAICQEEDNILLFGVYTTCLAKAAIQTKKDFVPEAIKLFVNYIKDPHNKVVQTAKVKKLIGDYANNKIEKYLE
jgi:hypothetical protein